MPNVLKRCLQSTSCTVVFTNCIMYKLHTSPITHMEGLHKSVMCPMYICLCREEYFQYARAVRIGFHA